MCIAITVYTIFIRQLTRKTMFGTRMPIYSFMDT